MVSLALFFTLLTGILTISLPRRFALVPILISTLYMTLGQRILIMDFDFTILRILILVGWIRIIIRRDMIPISLNGLDKVIICWGIVTLVTAALLDIDTTKLENLHHRSGQLFTALGSYFLFRFYINGLNDINRVLRILAIAIMPLAFAFLIEKASGKNMFFIFGGVPEVTMVRYGRLRCQGPFAHPILAGTLGATLMPLFAGLWYEKRKLSVIGLACATIIMVTSASSGPVFSYLCALMGLCAWPFRNNMRVIGWSLLLGLIMLHIVMKAPVWYLIGRMSAIMGGTGWHRSEVIDTFIRHFNEWWMIGTSYTANWLDYGALPNPQMIDITNQYVLEGVYGGLGRMILFIAIIVLGFRAIGNALNTLKNQAFTVRFLPWALGASLFAHTVTFISVAYFDQLIIIWYLLLAMIASTAVIPKDQR